MECVPHQKQNWGMQGYIYFFLSFAPKHRLWVQVFYRLGEAVITSTPIYVLSMNKKTRTPRRSISHLHWAKSIDREIKFKGTWSRCVLEGHVKDNYYARFQTRSYL